jgi:hypothetical protein
MRQKSHSTDLSSEEIVKGIRRATQRFGRRLERRQVLPVGSGTHAEFSSICGHLG